METAHQELEEFENEPESNSESEDEGDDEKSESYESGESDEESDDSGKYTFDEVRAIVSYYLSSNNR